MSVEKTLSIIKPDAVKRDLTGKIMDVTIKNFNHNTLFGEISL